MRHDWKVMSWVGKKGVSLERLQTLCLIAESGGVMAAAKGDQNRQSLFSRQIKELEQALQVGLLDRSTSPNQLTAEASQVVELAREFFAGVERVVTASTGRKPTVSIAAGESVIQWLLLPLLASGVGEQFVNYRFHNMTSRRAVDAIRSRQVDLAVVSLHEAVEDLGSKTVADFGVVLVGQPEHEWSRMVSWRRLEGEGLAVMEGNSELRRRIRELSHEHPDGPEVRIECTSYPQVIEACLRGSLLGILPELAKPAAREAGLKTWKLKELDKVRIELSMLWSQAVSDGRPEVAAAIRLLGK